MAKKARHVYGASSAVEQAKQDSKIDAYDILFLDGETKPTVGWLDKNGETRIVDVEKVIHVDTESLPASGVEGKIYIYKEEGYFWDGTEFKPLAKSTDVSALEAEIKTKVDEAKVLELIEQQVEGIVEIIEI